MIRLSLAGDQTSLRLAAPIVQRTQVDHRATRADHSAGTTLADRLIVLMYARRLHVETSDGAQVA